MENPILFNAYEIARELSEVTATANLDTHNRKRLNRAIARARTIMRETRNA
jgi:ribosomal protein L29